MHPRQQTESPRRTAGLISQLFFIWLVPLFQKGFRKTLELSDLFRVLPQDESRILGDKLEEAWNEEIRKWSKKKAEKKLKLQNGNGDEEGDDDADGGNTDKDQGPSLVNAIVKVFGPAYASYGIYAFYEECVLKIGQPIILGFLLRYFKNRDEYDAWVGWTLGGGVVLLSIIYTSSDHPYTFAVQHIGMKVRVSLCALLYRKALRTSKLALEERTSGQIVNFLASDMNRFDVCLTFLHYIWVAPLQLAIVLAVLFFYLGLGWPCLAGITLLIFFVPFQAIMGKVFSKLRSQTAVRTDRRLILMEEIIGAMRVIKMYAWEEIFQMAVNRARREELKSLKRTAYCKAINQSLFYVTSRIVLFLTLLTYVLLGNPLSSEIVFVSLALYNSVQSVMTLFFPAGVSTLAEALVAVERFKEFLLLEEYVKEPAIEEDEMHFKGRFEGGSMDKTHEDDGDNKPRRPRGNKPKNGLKGTRRDKGRMSETSFAPGIPNNFGIHMKNITAQWNSRTRDMAFNSVSLDVKYGEIVAVIGPVGAGKGSLLQAILRELGIKSGELVVRGRIGYVSQESWIFPGTVRQNILFGKEFDPEWYEEVIDACALTKDLQLLAYGDHTLVGDRGTALSGGQKARINLARAVYADMDIYLLDDPLSAVDTEVSRHLVDKCILGLLKSKPRVLVTHQLQYLSAMNEIVLLTEGFMRFKGSYRDLILSGIPFTEILTRRFPIDTQSMASNHLVRSKIHIRPSHATSSTTLVLDTSGKAPIAPNHPDIYVDEDEGGKSSGDLELRQQPQPLEEDIGHGGLRWRLYWAYLSAGSSCTAFFAIISIAIFTQIAFTLTDFWLQFWIGAEERLRENQEAEAQSALLRQVERDRNLQIGIYSGLVTTLFGLCLLRSLYFYHLCIRSSSELHAKLFNSVLRCPMFFFESVPMGRILNRFAKDIGVLDETLPPVMFDTLEIFLQTVGVIVIVSWTSTIMLIPAIIIAIVFYYIRKFYFYTARAIKRLEGVARSPLFSHISTSLNGLTTIRAFGVEAMFQKEFEDLMDVHSSVWYLFLACSRWLGIVVDWIAILFLAIVLLNFLCDENAEDTQVGLVVTSATMLTSMLQWGLRQSAELENQMISVERVMAYCELESEAEMTSDIDSQPPPDWPPRGEILFQNLSLKYDEDSPTFVLKNINCFVKAGEKVGVVGRTGAGKSSLLAVLFRLAEPCEGFIEIDGIITNSIGLHDLRSRISIIPQEPVLFLGSIRRNLDPFSQFTDLDIWEVLKDVNLDEAVKDLPEGLYAWIAEGGSNFSMGQKQLFCLARAILQNNQILVLDEATANVDPETDLLIQNTLRSNFIDCTVITIAHRLQTVMETDRVLFLDAGEILEFDEPEKLLEDKDSAFAKLVAQSGKEEAGQLFYLAKMAGARRRAKLQEEEDDDEDDNDEDDSDDNYNDDNL